MEKIKVGITTEGAWDCKWETIFDHYQQDLRHAYYINAFLDESDKSVLEIGAGSFRDAACLNKKFNVNCWGTDFSEMSVNMAKKHFSDIKEKFFQSNAFNFKNIPDNHFNTTFHNGLWVLFNNDNDVLNLLKEQARITQNKLIATVHNKHNKDFVEYFKKLSKKDDLYKIRFYEVDEITDLMKKECYKVDVIPVGKGKRHHEDQLINDGLGQRESLKHFFEEKGKDYLETSERLLCIGHLS